MCVWPGVGMGPPAAVGLPAVDGVWALQPNCTATVEEMVAFYDGISVEAYQVVPGSESTCIAYGTGRCQTAALHERH